MFPGRRPSDRRLHNARKFEALLGKEPDAADDEVLRQLETDFKELGQSATCELAAHHDGQAERAHKRLGSIVSECRQFWKFTSGRAIGFHALMLGKMYRDGIALPRNDVAAHKWLDISERWTPNASGWSIETPDGPVPLADEIRTLAEGMTPEQVAEAQRAADAFLDTYR